MKWTLGVMDSFFFDRKLNFNAQPDFSVSMHARILFISPQPFFEWRGSPIRVRYNLLALSALGYEIDLLTFPFGEEVDIPGVTIHRVDRIPGLDSMGIGPSLAKFRYDIKLHAAARRLLQAKNYAAIHAVEESAAFAAFLARSSGIPLIYEKHSDPGSYRKGWVRNLVMDIYARIERFSARRAKAVIVTGEGVAAQVRAWEPNKPVAHIFDLPSSLVEADPQEVRSLRAELCPEPATVLAGYVGSFAVYQGIDLLFDAIPHALERAPDLKILILGGTDAEIAERRSALATRGLAGRVHFAGKKSPEALPAWLAACDILLSPRISGKNTPLKLLDYLKAGAAILATDVPANRLLLTEETARFAPAASEPFAAALADLALHPDARQILAATGQHLVAQTYNFESYTRQIAILYQHVLPAS